MDQSYSNEINADAAGHGEGQQAEPPMMSREKPDGITDPAGEAGWYLERERVNRGLTLEDIGACTGIHPYHVEAIEYGDMTHMPPRLEALEMIAAYADFLGFDPDPLLQHYASFLPRPEVAPRRHPANPGPMMSAKVLPFGRFPKVPTLDFKALKLPPMPKVPGGRNGIVASVALAVMLLAGGGYMFSGGNAPDAPALEQIAESSDPMPTATTGNDAADVTVTESPIADQAANQPIAAPGEADADQAASAIPDPGAIPGTEGSSDTGDLGAFIAEQVEGSDAPETVSATSKPVDLATNNSGGGKVFGSSDEKVHVVLKATKAIWLLIEDGQGNRVATQMLNPGDIYRVPNRDGLVAIAQDGGALVYSIDGVEKGVLGQPGSLLAAEPLDVKALAAKG
ncbi:MAG: helix-turn-helix domain-containing protein [Rhizobiales bacterium]|nr:helix-turn-helix domain-containing protein [Hyphomicrobiales bacterium]